MRKLNAINAGSQLYAIFKNGIAYEFIHGLTLTKDSVKERTWNTYLTFSTHINETNVKTK